MSIAVENLDPTGQTIPNNNWALPGSNFVCVSPLTPATAGAPVGNDTTAVRNSWTNPALTIYRAYQLASDGDTIVFRGGTHRTWMTSSGTSVFVFNNKRLTLQPYQGEDAWIDGSDVIVGGWTQDLTLSNASRAVYTRSWYTPSFCGSFYHRWAGGSNSATTSESTARNPVQGLSQSPEEESCCGWARNSVTPDWEMAMDPQSVWVNGVRQKQVPQDSLLSVGTFRYDWTFGVRLMKVALPPGTTPNDHLIEFAARPTFMHVDDTSVTVRGLGFRRFASGGVNTAGALVMSPNPTTPSGHGPPIITVEDCVFTQNSFAAVDVAASNSLTSSPSGASLTITGCVFSYNGGTALVMNRAVNGEVSDCWFKANNIERFGVGCSAACGDAQFKVTRTLGLQVDHNIFDGASANEMAIWADVSNFGTIDRPMTITRNLIRNPGLRGIFQEIGGYCIIAGNCVVIPSPLVSSAASWGIATCSTRTKVWNNTVIVNRDQNSAVSGIGMFADNRNQTVPSADGYTFSEIYGAKKCEMVNNVIVNVGLNGNVPLYNGAISDRYWPGAPGVDTGTNGPIDTFPWSKADSLADPDDAWFAEFDFNAYWQRGSGSFIRYGWIGAANGSSSPWKPGLPASPSGPTFFTSLSSFATNTGWETNGYSAVGQTSDPFFVNIGAGDYRIRPSSVVAAGNANEGTPLSSDVAAALGETYDGTTAVQRGAWGFPLAEVIPNPGFIEQELIIKRRVAGTAVLHVIARNSAGMAEAQTISRLYEN